MIIRITLWSLILSSLLSVAPAQIAPPFPIQRPAVNSKEIVFSYAGDLWSVPRSGGEARRLTSGQGIETDPVFSPAGTEIAFTGEYGGNVDVFVMPAWGGSPRRLTYHPAANRAVAWSPDGTRVIFASSRTSENYGVVKLFSVPREGGFPEELPFPIASEASYSPDGRKLAYVPVHQMQEDWKRYRGGQTRKIWIANLSDSSVMPIPRIDSNDFNPMWIGHRIYFLSDRNGPVSLFYYDTVSKQVIQVLKNNGQDLMSAAAGQGLIVYEQFGSLHLVDIDSGESRPLEVFLSTDNVQTLPHSLNVAKLLRNPDISPSGTRAVFEARGEIITVPVEKGSPRNLTNNSNANARDPAWSPDGTTIAYLSDESGEYELNLRDQMGTGIVRKLQLGHESAFYYLPQWAPNGRHIAYTDNHLNLWYIDVQEKKPILIDRDMYALDHNWVPSWSPDGLWIAYRKHLPSRMGVICLYSIAARKVVTLTDGMSDAGNPIFDKSGQYLYFTASTNAGIARQPDILSRMDPVTRNVYLVVLSRVQKSPFTPESDEEEPSGATAPKSDKAADKSGVTGAPSVQIDLDHIEDRILAVPLPARRYEDLQVGKPGVLYAIDVQDRNSVICTVYRFNLKQQKTETIVQGVTDVRISQSGAKMLYRLGDRWIITEPVGRKNGAGDDSFGRTLKT
jgi:tricorn protease